MLAVEPTLEKIGVVLNIHQPDQRQRNADQQYNRRGVQAMVAPMRKKQHT